MDLIDWGLLAMYATSVAFIATPPTFIQTLYLRLVMALEEVAQETPFTIHMDSESRCLTLSDSNMTASEFAARIEWEGGVYEAYECGLRAEYLAEHLNALRHAWQAFVDAMDDAADHAHDFQFELEKHMEMEEELD